MSKPASSSRPTWRSGNGPPCSASPTSGNTPEIEGLIRYVTVTAPRDALFGQQLEVIQLVSDRGANWVTVRIPNGTRRNIKRGSTDLASPLPDSNSTLIVSASVLLRVACFITMLSRRTEEESRNEQEHGSDKASQSAITVVEAAGTNPTTISDTSCSRSARKAARSRRK